MHAKNKFVCLIALLLAVFALPSVAGNDKKIYNLQMAIISAPPAIVLPPFTVQATLASEPTGNSSFNSFSLSVVGLTIVGVDQPTSGNATFTPSSVTVVNASPVKPGKNISVTIRVSSCGDGAWSASAWTGAKLNGQSFDLVPANSMLATSISCGDAPKGAAFNVPDSLNANCISGTRDYYDKDGTVPVSVPFFVTNTLSQVNGQLHFRWPTIVGPNSDPKAAFEYTVCGPGALPAPPAHLDTQVAWLTDVGGYPVFIDAPKCIEPNQLPAPYGTLVGVDGSTIRVDKTTPSLPIGTIAYPGSEPTDPNHGGSTFDIIIGTERIKVQWVCLDNDNDGDDPADCSEYDEDEGEALHVLQRGVAGVADHAPGVLVMSTPLPLLTGVSSPYVTGRQAQMCIAAQANQTGGHFTTLIDIGDGYTKLP